MVGKYAGVADPHQIEILDRHTASAPVKVGALAEDLGLKVVLAPMAPNISGLIQPSQTSRSGYEVKINKYEVKARQRFTLAHEIAHFLLHKRYIGAALIDSIMYRSTLTSRKEAEANRLAADIIMPVDLVETHLKELSEETKEGVSQKLAKKFEVSVAAMNIRLGGE